MTAAYIGLGGNVGDVISNMAGALQSLDQLENTKVEAVSRVYRTPPWGIEDQDWFYNSCAMLETRSDPGELLEICLKIERHFKRKRTLRWGPRTLDLDILLFGEATVHQEELTIPHPRMHERLFVMRPLNDIAPEVDIMGKIPAYWIDKIGESEVKIVDLPQDWWT
ncbi:MAG: 2-amino-4-hydroxy-6-hydroxymethyldihydropteridine diphosphokinase [Rhizobiaceae bacterium]